MIDKDELDDTTESKKTNATPKPRVKEVKDGTS